MIYWLLWLAVRKGGLDLTTPANVLMLTRRQKGGEELVDVAGTGKITK